MTFIIIVAVLTSVYVVGMDLVKKYTDNIDMSSIVKNETNIMVQITGEVVDPGVYEIKEGSTLSDLITLAGGLTESADASSINLVRILEDKTRYNIPIIGETKELININTASVSELTEIPGIGSSIASRIVAYRLENGKFSSIEELCNVKGIKEATLEKISSYIKVE